MNRAFVPRIAIPLAITLVGTVAFAAQAPSPDRIVTLEGPVLEFVAGASLGLPTLVVDDAVLGEVEIRLAPYRVLRDLGFVVSIGDQVRVTALPCVTCEADFSALEVTDLTTGESWVLRDGTGQPGWVRRPAARSADPYAAEVEDSFPTTTLEATGEVAAFLAVPGSGHPILTLMVDGTAMDFVVAPIHAWKTAGWTPEIGQILTVGYVDVHLAEDIVHVAVWVSDDAVGVTLLLRDPETGRPVATYRLRLANRQGAPADTPDPVRRLVRRRD